MLNGRHWDPCVGGQRNVNIEKGLAYMDKHVDELLGGDYYGMYGVERIGVASGRKYFGNERTTFVIDSEGTVAEVLRKVKPAEHDELVLSALRESTPPVV